MFKLGGSSDLPSNAPQVVDFDFGSEGPVDAACFDPLRQFDHIGEKKLDQVCREVLSHFCSLFSEKLIYLLFILAPWCLFASFMFVLCSCTYDVRRGAIFLPRPEAEY